MDETAIRRCSSAYEKPDVPGPELTDGRKSNFFLQNDTLKRPPSSPSSVESIRLTMELISICASAIFLGITLPVPVSKANEDPTAQNLAAHR